MGFRSKVLFFFTGNKYHNVKSPVELMCNGKEGSRGGGGVLPMVAYTGRGKGYLLRERVGKSIISVCKMAQKGYKQMHFMDVKKVEKTFWFS